ncbi:MAG: transglutaminase-like domain-containing protein [Verrucomicrobiae bacterium]|nr:transglutaminase-like domain-containing protein [Verrucomicrobiae bacterium]
MSWPVGVGLLCFGVGLWAKARDPFERAWFTVKPATAAKAKCVAVLPKAAARPYPVVVCAPPAREDLLSIGFELRQLAEMGLAAVGIEYDPTNDVAGVTQVAALQRSLQTRPWAVTNAVAWVGWGEGAQRLLESALRHPELCPELLVLLWPTWPTEWDKPQSERAAGMARVRPLAERARTIVWVQGQREGGVPLAHMERIATLLRSKGHRVELKIVAAEKPGFGPARAALFRLIGEACLVHFAGAEWWRRYRSVTAWPATVKPLGLYLTPVLIWALVAIGLRWSRWRRWLTPRAGPPVGLEICVWGLAVLLAGAAFAYTALHWIVLRLPANGRTLPIAKRFVVRHDQQADWEFLATNLDWQGQRIKTILEHVALAAYNRRVVEWKVDDPLYRPYVLSPQIAAVTDPERNWRRLLWENLFPHIRRESRLDAATEIIVWQLRSRVTVADAEQIPTGVESIWRRQLANQQGFAKLSVAALRSVGIPARLGPQGAGEFWNGAAWAPVARPYLSAASSMTAAASVVDK